MIAAERIWCNTPSNIGLLIRWLDQQGLTLNWDASDFAYVCERPEKWQAEWDELQAALRAGERADAA